MHPRAFGDGRGRVSGLSVSLSHHERIPELEDVDARAEDAAEIEELRSPVRTVIVMHRHLDDRKPRVLDLLHHLETDDAAVLLEMNLVEDRAAQHPEVAVDVVHAKTEHDLH